MKRLYRNFDRTLFIATLIIVAIGLSSIYSATYAEGSSITRGLFFKQILWVIMGLLLLFVVINIDYGLSIRVLFTCPKKAAG